MKKEFTIFYTDDDQDDLDFFTEIVDSIDNNYKVVTYTNGKQLLEALRNPPPTLHILFLDINMPGMNGLEVLKMIRESENYKNLPIVMFSTSTDKETIQKSFELGANFYVPKSGMFDQLKKSIEHAVKMNWNNFTTTENNFVYSYL